MTADVARAGRAMRSLAMAVLVVGAGLSMPADAAPAPTPGLGDVAFDQHLGVLLPLRESFVDERGRAATLSSLLDGRPAIIVLGYYECPNLCSAVRQSLVGSLARMDLEPDAQYRVIAVSIDPAETNADAAHARAALDDRAGATTDTPSAGGAAPHAGNGIPAVSLEGWHFLTGTREATRALADAVGFHYVYDAALKQYAHPSGIVIVTPQGRVSRYFLGVDFPPAALRQTLVAAADDVVGSPVRALLLRCFHYDPVTGRYTGAVVTASRLLGVLSVVALLVTVLRLRRRVATAPFEDRAT